MTVDNLCISRKLQRSLDENLTLLSVCRVLHPQMGKLQLVSRSGDLMKVHRPPVVALWWPILINFYYSLVALPPGVARFYGAFLDPDQKLVMSRLKRK